MQHLWEKYIICWHQYVGFSMMLRIWIFYSRLKCILWAYNQYLVGKGALGQQVWSSHGNNEKSFSGLLTHFSIRCCSLQAVQSADLSCCCCLATGFKNKSSQMFAAAILTVELLIFMKILGFLSKVPSCVKYTCETYLQGWNSDWDPA